MSKLYLLKHKVRKNLLKLFLIVSLFNSVFLLSAHSQNVIGVDLDSIPLMEKISKSVWKVSERGGTAFAIRPNLFITNLHVLSSFLKYGRPIQTMVLSQEGTKFKIRVKRLVAISVSDLALLETEENVTDYLTIADSFVEHDDLFIVGYPLGKLSYIKNVEGITYEDRHTYLFPVNASCFRLNGASGSPIVNKNGKVVGVLSGCFPAIVMADVIKLNSLQKFISGREGLDCSNREAKDCLLKFIMEYESLYNIDDAYFQYSLGMIYIHGVATESSFAMRRYWETLPEQDLDLLDLHDALRSKEMDLGIIWLKKSAQRGYPPAQYALAIWMKMSYQDRCELIAKSAQQGYPPAQKYDPCLPQLIDLY